MRTLLSEFLKSKFADRITEQELFRDQQSFVVKPDAIVSVCEALLNDENLEVKFLADITCVDRSEEHTSELPVTDVSRMPSSACKTKKQD